MGRSGSKTSSSSEFRKALLSEQGQFKGGFKIRTTSSHSQFSSEPLYDFDSSFWANYERGPRPLTAKETEELERLASEIGRIESESGARTSTKFFSRFIDSPFGLASGPAPNFKWLECFAKLGYDVLTYKTVRDRQWTGHGMPNLVHVQGDFVRGFESSASPTGSITNSLGMPAPEPEVWKKEAALVAASKGKRFFAMSVTATLGKESSKEDMLEQFSLLSEEAKKVGADGVELNLSCPNVLPGEGGETYSDARLSGEIVEAVRSDVGSGYPVLVKIGFLHDYSALVDATYDDRVGYVAINSVAAPVKGPHGESLFKDRGGRAGICGDAIRELAIEAVSGLAALRTEERRFPIVGLGGVITPEDAAELMSSGADVVESATGALLDPTLALKVRLLLLKSKARVTA